MPKDVLLPEARAARISRLLFSQGCEVFAVLDAARDSGVLSLLEGGDCEYACLYKGPSAVTYRAFAPYLVRLEAGTEVLHRLLTRAWSQSVGYYIGSVAGQDSLHQHLRRFLTVALPTGRSAYFRFYDPRVMRSFLATITPQQAGSLWRDQLDWLFMEDVDDRYALVFTARALSPPNALGETASACPSATLNRARIRLDDLPSTPDQEHHHADRTTTV